MKILKTVRSLLIATLIGSIPLISLAAPTGSLDRSGDYWVSSVQNGDAACYFRIKRDGDKREETYAGEFYLCAHKGVLQGKRWRLNFKREHIMSASCQGDMNCKRTDEVWLVSGASIPRGKNN